MRNMAKFEYKIFTCCAGFDQCTEYQNEFGQERWEAYAVHVDTGTTFFMKREIDIFREGSDENEKHD